MVVLLDLDDDDGAFDPFARPTSLPGLQTPSRYDDPYDTVTPDASRKSEDTRHGPPPPAEATDRANPNLNHVFSTALACYPYAPDLFPPISIPTSPKIPNVKEKKPKKKTEEKS